MIAATPRGFLTNPALRWVGFGEERQELLEPLIYVAGNGERFEVPAGTVTDYASIPRLFWNLKGFNPYGPAKMPAVLHDYLYALRGGEPYEKSRRECDDLFLEAMQLVGVGWLHRHVIYAAVRLMGGIHSMGRAWRRI